MGMAKKSNTTAAAPVTPAVQAVEQKAPETKGPDYGTPQKETTHLGAAYYVTSGFGKPMTQYEIDKDRRISRAGIYQAVVQSAGLATLPFKTRTDFVKLVEDTAEDILKLVNKAV